VFGVIEAGEVAGGFGLPGSLSVNGESDLLSIVSGGGLGRRTRPATKPAASNVRITNNAGASCCLRSRRAQSLQNLRLVQKYQRKRSTFAPHSAQKFGWYLVRNRRANIGLLTRKAT
jgi:hypothetical protein